MYHNNYAPDPSLVVLVQYNAQIFSENDSTYPESDTFILDSGTQTYYKPIITKDMAKCKKNPSSTTAKNQPTKTTYTVPMNKETSIRNITTKMVKTSEITDTIYLSII